MRATTGQRVAVVIGLVVILAALAPVLIPFKDGGVNCDPAIVSAFDDGSIPARSSDVGEQRDTSSTLLCRDDARRRAATSVVVLGLAIIGIAVSSKLLSTRGES